jgi:hypothetical protein
MSRRPFVGSAGFNEDRLAAVAEKASPGTVAGVEASRVGALEPSHACHQIGRRCLDEEVTMVTHQDPCPDSEAGTLAAFAPGSPRTGLHRPRRAGQRCDCADCHMPSRGKGPFKLDVDLPRHRSKGARSHLSQIRKSFPDPVPIGKRR